MAKRYVLGERAARFLHEGMTSHFGEELTSGKHISQALSYPAPWTVRWSASTRCTFLSEEYEGWWVIYLPDGCLKGAYINSTDESIINTYMRPLDNSVNESDTLPKGWYVMPFSGWYVQSGVETKLFARNYYGMLSFSNDGGVKIADIIFDSVKKSRNVRQIASGIIDLTSRAFDIYEIIHSTGTVKFENCVWTIGSISYTYGASDGDRFFTNSVSECAGKIVSIRITTGNAGVITLEKHDSLSQINSDSISGGVYYHPLYWFDANMGVRIDFRTMPTLNAWEKTL